MSKKEIRDSYKNRAENKKSDNPKKNCSKYCFFNNIFKYCGNHPMTTKSDEFCNQLKI